MKRFKVKIWNDVYNAYYEKEHIVEGVSKEKVMHFLEHAEIVKPSNQVKITEIECKESK